MAEQKDGKVTLSVTELKELLTPQQQAQQAATEADGENAFNRYRAEAQAKAREQHWRAFRSETGAVGVALVTQSKTHPRSGRVLKFDHYERPPEDQFPPCDIAKEDRFRNGEPTSRFQAWVWAQFGVIDHRNLIGIEADRLPDVCPPRATLEDAMSDIPALVERRNAAFQQRAQLQDPTIERKLAPLPKTVPVSR